jgi:hypothetical protein
LLGRLGLHRHRLHHHRLHRRGPQKHHLVRPRRRRRQRARSRAVLRRTSFPRGRALPQGVPTSSHRWDHHGREPPRNGPIDHQARGCTHPAARAREVRRRRVLGALSRAMRLSPPRCCPSVKAFSTSRT